jgi:hypothetical protein
MLMAVSGVARPQPADVFYPFGHPTPYTYRFFPQFLLPVVFAGEPSLYGSEPKPMIRALILMPVTFAIDLGQ